MKNLNTTQLRDTFAKIMHDVCYDVEAEPILQLLQGESFIHKSTSTDEKRATRD